MHAILTHELSHVRRGDHIVRWLEWLVCSAFWWNPVAWWARHQLRIAEEACCDRLALDTAGSCPRTYANALLRVVTSTSAPPGYRPPLPASAAGGVGRARELERRLTMIVSNDTSSPAPRWLRAATWVAVLCALPFGLIYCDRSDAPTGADEEEAAGLVVPDAPQEVSEPAESDIEAILATREEEINQGILQEVESGALSAVQGLELSAYVAGAKAGLLISYGDRDLSEAEKQLAADRLSESVDRKRPPDGTAMRDTLLQRELIQSALREHSELIRRVSLRLVRFHPIEKRPAPPIIKGPLPLLPKRPPGGASQIRNGNIDTTLCNVYFTTWPIVSPRCHFRDLDRRHSMRWRRGSLPAGREREVDPLRRAHRRHRRRGRGARPTFSTGSLARPVSATAESSLRTRAPRN